MSRMIYLTGLAEDIAQHHIKILKGSRTVACKAGAMHDGERFGL